SSPSLTICSDKTFAQGVPPEGPSVPSVVVFDDLFAGLESGSNTVAPGPIVRGDSEPATIVYTSGTSGEQKGVLLTVGNITFMLGCTNGRLDILMGARSEPDRVFQYAPFCFGAARILLLTSLSRNSLLLLSTDLTKLSDELKLASPNYFV